MGQDATSTAGRRPRPRTLTPVRVSDDLGTDGEFSPAPPDEAAFEGGAFGDRDAPPSNALPRPVRRKAVADRATRANASVADEGDVAKTRGDAYDTLKASRVRDAGSRMATSSFGSFDTGRTPRAATASPGGRRKMAKRKSKRRIGVVKLTLILTACAVFGTWIGLYLQESFNDILPKSSLYDGGKAKAEKPKPDFSF